MQGSQGTIRFDPGFWLGIDFPSALLSNDGDLDWTECSRAPCGPHVLVCKVGILFATLRVLCSVFARYVRRI